MGWSLCNCYLASCAVQNSWALALFIDFVNTSPLSTHLALSYVQKSLQVTCYSPKGTWDPVLGLVSADRIVELGGWDWVRLWVCQWVGSGSWHSCTAVPAVFLEICSIKGLICHSDWPTDAGWLCPHSSFALWAKCSSQRTERVSESEQKCHMEAPLSQLGQCWLPATAPPIPEDPAVLLTALRSTGLLSALHFRRVGVPCWALLAAVCSGWGVCSLMTQTRSEANQQQWNTPQHCPSLNKDPSFCTGGASPGSACN